MSKKKSAILRAATTLFANKGYRQTSIAELSRLTGVAEGTIFYHFKTKEHILLAVLRSIRQRLERGIEKAAARQGADDGLQRVLSALTAYMSLSAEMKDEFLMLQRYFPYQISRRNPESHDIMEAITAGFIDFFESALAAGQADGSIEVASTRKTAMILYALADGIVRLHAHDIHTSGPLYEELMHMARRMLASAKASDMAPAAAR